MAASGCFPLISLGCGPEIQCIVTATPFKGPQGEVIGIVEDFKDISERKRTEKELIQSRRV